MKTLLAMTMVALGAGLAFGAVEVRNVKAQQRYPWNGKVDIDYEVVADDAETEVWVYPTGYNKDLNHSLAPRTLTGDGVGVAVKPGKHRMTWDVSQDYPSFAASEFTVKMVALTGGAPYMVIDVSGGVDALSYPVSYLSKVPDGGWSDEYKTTKIVLRLCPPGTFMMGSPTDEWGHNFAASETLHSVILTKPFYMGVFEITQKQYELVMGSNPSNWKYTKRPVEQVNYNTIRGTVNGVAWPAHNQVDANSFMGRLRSKANVLADLPTEAQWEYACRAGTSTALNSGKNLTGTQTCSNVDEVAWYASNSGSQTHEVGLKKENVWGLYDMHGNVAEWCLDWWLDNLGSGAVTDPKGGNSGDYRVVRGGCWYSNSGYAGSAGCCRSAYRTSHHGGGDNWGYWTCRPYPSSNYNYFGFRLQVSPVE